MRRRANEAWVGRGTNAARRRKMLFAQVLARDLNALVGELLKVSAELIATVRPTVEELTHDTNRCV